jgi:alpha-beta hydrolase superfamily lysophospholipase
MDDTLRTADGVALKLRHWPLDAPRGRVLLVHGLGEHAGRYGHVAAALNAAGWAVSAHDHRGHGQSAGARGVLAADDSLLQDLACVVDAVRGAGQGPGPGPFVLLGHSMGGLVAARFVAEALAAQPARWSRAVDALVLSSPALDAGLSGPQKLLLTVMGRLAPDWALGNGLKPEWVSRDPAVVRAYLADPLVHGRVTPRLVRFIVDGGRCVRERAPQWRVPTLLLYAGADRCVAPAGSRAFAAAAPPAVVTAQAFEPLYHEIFNEPEQAQVLERLTAWLDTLTAPRGDRP